MGTKYSANSISGYNATPPVDDGTVSEANKVKWSTIKTKLSDPINTLAAAIDSDLQTHFDVGPTAVTSNTTLGASHYNQIIQVSGASVTLTLTDAATLGAGWYCRVVSTDSSNNTTIARATSGDTINGSAADFTLTALHAIDIFVNAAANGFFIRSLVTNPTTTDTAQTISAVKTFTADPILTSTDAGAGVGPVFDLYRDSASPAASDLIGAIRMSGENSTGAQVTYAQVNGSIVDPTAGSEDGRLNFQTTVAGTTAVRGYVDNGMVLGSATGGDKGAGTINASAIYDDGEKIFLPVLRDVSSTLISNSNTETTILTGTVPGGTLGTNRMLRVTLAGAVYDVETSTPVVTTVRFKFGGTTVGTLALAATTDNNVNPRALCATCLISAANSTGSQRVHSYGTLGAPAAVGATAAIEDDAASFYTALSLDSTLDQTLEVTVQLDIASASVQFDNNFVHVEVI